MAPGWYILNYHDVNWENSALLRGVGGTVPPDVFRQQVGRLREMGRLISVDSGLDMLLKGENPTEPTFSFWFDDGLIGVRKYALPILRAAGITGAMSVCGRFTRREEMFWRFQLSYLSFVDGIRVLRSRLRPLGYKFGQEVRGWTLSNFSLEVRKAIESVYRECTTEERRHDHFRVFDSEEGIRQLAQEGWLISNHSLAHFPVRAHMDREFVMGQFRANEEYIQELGGNGAVWVIPFAGGYFEKPQVRELYRWLADTPDVTLIGVEEAPNTVASYRDHKLIFRINPEWTDARRPPIPFLRPPGSVAS